MTDTLAAPHPAGAAAADDDVRRLLGAFRLLQMHHARVLRTESVERGLNATDTRLVFFLAAADDAGVTPKQAGEYLELSTGAMTSLVDRLVGRGLIERRPNPGDRRSILLHLTPAGTAIAEEIGALYGAAFRAVVAPEHRDAFAATLEGLGLALTTASAAPAS